MALYDPKRYKFPIECNPNLPKPSNANYNPKNVAWMIEFFATIIGQDYTNLQFRYENNTCDTDNLGTGADDDIFVEHPKVENPDDDKIYLDEASQCRPKSADQDRYENAAKKSTRLRNFMNEVGLIEYFKDSCDPSSIKTVAIF